MSDLTGKSLGNYHIFNRLGDGAKFPFYEYFDMRFKMNVELLKATLQRKLHSEMFLKHFECGADVLGIGNLSRLKIFKTFGCDFKKGKLYFVLEHILGKILEEYLVNNKIKARQEVGHILLSIASTLHYVHRQKVFNHDVKPLNIFSQRMEKTF